MSLPIPAELAVILERTPELGEAYLVGGCVRDWLWEIPGKDFDIEVFGIDYEQLVQALSRWGRTDLVGRSFGVVKLTAKNGALFDFSIPRRDSKVAIGHKGFEVSLDPTITPREAASRRDFTINALMYDPRRHAILDFFNGRHDVESRILRHTSDAFSEDPLRVLRGMQFIGRFGLHPDPGTVAICRNIRSTYRELAGERVRDEWFKWASKSTSPSGGLRFLLETGWLEHFPEILALAGTPQDPEWHPEGDVFTHTGHCLDALVNLPEWRAANPETRIVYTLAVLGHDFAKPETTEEALKDGRRRIISPGHEEAGGPIAQQFLERIHVPLKIVERVLPLVTNHLAHLQTLSDRAVRRLAKRLEPSTIEDLLIIIAADQFGRPPKPQTLSENVVMLKERAEALRVQLSAPRPVLMGRHLLDLGLRPGKTFGTILGAAYEAQLEGKFAELQPAYHWLATEPELPLTEEIRTRARARAGPGAAGGETTGDRQ